MKIQTILLLIGTATALVPRNKETSEVGSNIFASEVRKCSKWGECCPPTCSDKCCDQLKCHNREIPTDPGVWEATCKIN
ncbi:hypothetical protein Vi05172_g2221 [Venturia inaequalis]|nr:hypothetical protein Vi05172_g2221 [Venturia inaequalis]